MFRSPDSIDPVARIREFPPNPMPNMSLSSRRAACALCLVAVPGFLRGQAAPEVIELERMEVSAQKRVQAIQDVPIALNAYSGTFLETAGIGQYKDLAPLVPGLFVQQQSPNFPGINIRGVTSDSTEFI